MNYIFRNKFTYVVFLLLTIIVVSSIVLIEKNKKSDSVVSISGEFERMYESVESLHIDSDLVLEVTAGNVHTLKYEGLVFSLTDSFVKKVYKGPNPGPSINILETGGLFEGIAYIFEGNPVFKSNESAVVFLKKYIGPVAENAYYITGSIQGKFKIDGGRLEAPHHVSEGLAHVKELKDLQLY
ncbi:hypothetical protein D3C73_559820 [compost metagenome]